MRLKAGVKSLQTGFVSSRRVGEFLNFAFLLNTLLSHGKDEKRTDGTRRLF